MSKTEKKLRIKQAKILIKDKRFEEYKAAKKKRREEKTKSITPAKPVEKK